MLLHDFPDLQWLKKQAENRFSNRRTWNGKTLVNNGWPSVILNVKTSEIYRDHIPGPLSLFSNLSGASYVSVDGRKTLVSEDYFFLTNASQRYTLQIEKNKTSETFNIHFGEKWAEETFISLNEKTEKLIDQPDRAQDIAVHFFNKLFIKDETVKAIQNQLLFHKEEGDLKQSELLFQLAAHLLQQNRHINAQAFSLPVIKHATREEITRRLFLATDYIYSFYQRNLSLDELATVSCLSKFHFLRLFRQVFNKTPHQFITEVRIKKATSLLKNPNSEIKQIAKQTGFENASSFSRLFYNQLGVYPSQFR